MAQPTSVDGAQAAARADSTRRSRGPRRSNGRVFVAEFGEEYFEFAQVHRFWNGAISVGGHIRWTCCVSTGNP